MEHLKSLLVFCNKSLFPLILTWEERRSCDRRETANAPRSVLLTRPNRTLFDSSLFLLLIITTYSIFVYSFELSGAQAATKYNGTCCEIWYISAALRGEKEKSTIVKTFSFDGMRREKTSKSDASGQAKGPLVDVHRAPIWFRPFCISIYFAASQLKDFFFCLFSLLSSNWIKISQQRRVKRWRKWSEKLHWILNGWHGNGDAIRTGSQ